MYILTNANGNIFEGGKSEALFVPFHQNGRSQIEGESLYARFCICQLRPSISDGRLSLPD